MERLSIMGDFFDCQLYGGRLYLWTFNGSLRVYNYPAIIREWARRFDVYDFRCQHYENGETRFCITSEELRSFLLYERDYLTNEFPTGTEVLSGGLFESNAKGLFTCKIPMYSRYEGRMPVVKLSDTPLVYISGAQRRGLVCAGGSDGIFWMPRVTVQHELLHVSNRQTIRAMFCEPGIYAHSGKEEDFLLVKEEGHYETMIKAQNLFPEVEQIAFGQRMTWSWGRYFYMAENQRLLVYEFISKDKPMVLKDEVHFWGWKGEFVSAGSCECGTVVELDNAICLFEDWKKEEGGCTIMGPVTRWRMYPRSKDFSSHVHIIFDDRMDIVVLNDDVRMWLDMRKMRQHFYVRRELI